MSSLPYPHIFCFRFPSFCALPLPLSSSVISFHSSFRDPFAAISDRFGSVVTARCFVSSDPQMPTAAIAGNVGILTAFCSSSKQFRNRKRRASGIPSSPTYVRRRGYEVKTTERKKRSAVDLPLKFWGAVYSSDGHTARREGKNATGAMSLGGVSYLLLLSVRLRL